MIRILSVLALLSFTNIASACNVAIVDASRFKNTTLKSLAAALRPIDDDISVIEVGSGDTPNSTADKLPVDTNVVVVHFSVLSPATHPNDNGPFGEFVRAVERKGNKMKYIVFSRAFGNASKCDTPDILNTVTRESQLPDLGSRLCLVFSAPPRFNSDEKKRAIEALVSAKCKAPV